MRLHLIASKPTDSVTFGFLPAAARLGLDVSVLTDQPEAHECALAEVETEGCPGPAVRPAARGTDRASARLVRCDPWDVRTLIAQMASLGTPDAVLSNSDHLQVQAALAAEYFGLPGKDWRSALRAKDKALMRRHLRQTGAEDVVAAEITSATAHPVHSLPYPVVLKPAGGVASEDVVLASDPADLASRCREIFSRRPGERLVAEQYLPGALRTLETLGDGVTTWVLGGFRTQVSAPPFFIEERLTWDAPVPAAAAGHVLGALGDLGVCFGACHTEFVADADGGARLVEVNDRLIGDDCDFLLSDLLGVDLFELTLQVYLGQALPPGPPPAPPGPLSCAIADYVVADRPGVLAAAPPGGAQPSAEPGVVLGYRPLRHPGERITLTHANRDYLGVISAMGPGQAAVARGIAAFREQACWEIRAEPQP